MRVFVLGLEQSDFLALLLEQLRPLLPELAKLVAKELAALEPRRNGSDSGVCPKRLWLEPEAAKSIGMSRETLKKLRCAGRVKAASPPGSKRPAYGKVELDKIEADLRAGLLILPRKRVAKT